MCLFLWLRTVPMVTYLGSPVGGRILLQVQKALESGDALCVCTCRLFCGEEDDGRSSAMCLQSQHSRSTFPAQST